MIDNKIDFKILTDESLIKHIGKHRDIVLSLLYDRYEKRIYYKALSILKNKADAMDLSHDIFIKIFTNLDKYQGRSRFSLWVHSISFNTCIKYLNKKKKILIFNIEDQCNEVMDNSDQDITEKQLLEIDLNALESYMLLLKEEERIIMLMKYMDGLSIKEISFITNLKESNIKMKLMRTREKLLKMYHNRLK